MYLEQHTGDNRETNSTNGYEKRIKLIIKRIKEEFEKDGSNDTLTETATNTATENGATIDNGTVASASIGSARRRRSL